MGNQRGVVIMMVAVVVFYNYSHTPTITTLVHITLHAYFRNTKSTLLTTKAFPTLLLPI